MATKKFKCTVCGYEHEGDAAPEKCPVCQQPTSVFKEITSDEAPAAAAPKKKGINVNSNAYILTYASIMVVIVAFLLAYCSLILAPKSLANERQDKKSQILAALNLRGLEKSLIESTYEEVIVADRIIKADGTVVKEGADKDKAGFDVKNADLNADNLPLYICQVNGQTKYVIPLLGQGLWNSIWGYIALNDDKNTVYGVYFSHAGETAGLGARIVEYEGFQQQFESKKVFAADGKTVALSVIKQGKVVKDLAPENTCDGITGATLTGDGVHAMIQDCLKNYATFLTTNE